MMPTAVTLDVGAAIAGMIALEDEREAQAELVGRTLPRALLSRISRLERYDRVLAEFERGGLKPQYRGPIIPRHRTLVRVEAPHA